MRALGQLFDGGEVLGGEVAAPVGLRYGCEFALGDGGERVFGWLVGGRFVAYLPREDAVGFWAQGEALRYGGSR
jgi:hypothetical protein